MGPRAKSSACIGSTPKAWPCSEMWIFGGLVMAVHVPSGLHVLHWFSAVHVCVSAR